MPRAESNPFLRDSLLDFMESTARRHEAFAKVEMLAMANGYGGRFTYWDRSHFATAMFEAFESINQTIDKLGGLVIRVSNDTEAIKHANLVVCHGFSYSDNMQQWVVSYKDKPEDQVTIPVQGFAERLVN